MKRTTTFLDHFSAFDIFFAAYRYFNGRPTIQSSWFFKCLDDVWDKLPPHVREFVELERKQEREVKEIVNMVERAFTPTLRKGTPSAPATRHRRGPKYDVAVGVREAQLDRGSVGRKRKHREEV